MDPLGLLTSRALEVSGRRLFRVSPVLAQELGALIGGFRNLGAPYVGVLRIRILLFRVLILGPPLFGNPPIVKVPESGFLDVGHKSLKLLTLLRTSARMLRQMPVRKGRLLTTFYMGKHPCRSLIKFRPLKGTR